MYNQKYLSSWLITITLIRNIIAHHGRLWNRVISNKYDWPNKTSKAHRELAYVMASPISMPSPFGFAYRLQM
ncbi:Abi family protein [Nitritalea halalkaliphila]|uniref:Abi family protein n=1 Tax=Nitritalea halalkaliphila TaxID=590849 RepID=UPI001EE65F96|nr:Abi family protein [Nitritalea halalkaliphila]